MGMKWVAAWVPLFWGVASFGQTNSWDSVLGGNWHDNLWSAGVLPGTNQTILITNAGIKTVRIGPETVAGYPETLRVESVTVSAPSDWRSTLLLGSTGTNEFQARRLHIDEGGELVVANSAMVTDELKVKGAAAQWGDSYVYPSTLELAGGGVYDLVDGTFRAGRQYIRSSAILVGEGENLVQLIQPGVFNQHGGTNQAYSSLEVEGIYQLTGGTLNSRWSGYAALNLKGGTFNQFAGIVEMPVLLGRAGMGTYNLSGGLRRGGPVHIWSPDAFGSGRFVQTGGTNIGAIQIAPHIPLFEYGRDSYYIMEDGEVRSTSVNIGPYGHFTQSGGVHYNETLTVSNSVLVCRRYQPGRPTDPMRDCRTAYATYGLSGGVLHSSSIWSAGRFTQTGGSLVVGQLNVPGSFSHTGGDLAVTTITLAGTFTDGGGTINHRGRFNFQYGAWWARPGQQALGPLALGSGTTTTRARIVFPPESASTLQFANSGGISWPGTATLVITNWNGSFGDGGRHQLRFGDDATGLTPAQLERIHFENPGGLGGVHAARILADGEVVPAPVRLVAQKQGGQLQLHAPQGFVVQTSTNIHGPFEDLPAALSTSPLQFTEPVRFFRMRPEAQ
jgi:hypothetical protein